MTEAHDIVAEREQDYGDASISFARIAALWTAHLNTEVTPNDVALMMILLKVSRTKTSPYKHDNWLDIAGYAHLGEQLNNIKENA